jgi:hypothetical protein
MHIKIRFYGKPQTLSDGRKWTLRQACVLNTRTHKVEYAATNAVKLCTVHHIQACADMSVLNKIKSTHPLNDNHKFRSCLKHIASPLQRLTL